MTFPRAYSLVGRKLEIVMVGSPFLDPQTIAVANACKKKDSQVSLLHLVVTMKQAEMNSIKLRGSRCPGVFKIAHGVGAGLWLPERDTYLHCCPVQ